MATAYDASEVLATLLTKVTTAPQVNSTAADGSRKEYLTSQAVATMLDEADPLKRFRGDFHIPPRDLTTPKPDNTTADNNNNNNNAGAAACAASADDASADCVYLCGNSLGLQPRNTERYLVEELSKWRTMGVEVRPPHKNPNSISHNLSKSNSTTSRVHLPITLYLNIHLTTL